QCSRPICAIFTHATAHGCMSPSSPCNTGAHSLSPLVLEMQPAHMCRIHTCRGSKSHMSPSSRLHQYSIIHLAPPRQESSLISGPANTVPRDLSSPVSLFLGIWRGHQASSPGRVRLRWAIYISSPLLLPSSSRDLKDLNVVKWYFTS